MSHKISWNYAWYCSQINGRKPDLLDLRLSPELSNLVYNTVQSIINLGSKYHIDNKPIVTVVMDKRFTLTDEEKKQVSMQIDLLCDNGNIKI